MLSSELLDDFDPATSRRAEWRVEQDSLGDVHVRKEALWGAQTQRSLQNFRIGGATRDRMPLEVVHAMAIVKKASARTNLSLGKLGADKCALIVRAADEVSERIVYERQVSACVCVCVCCAPGGGVSGRQRSRRNKNIMNNDTQTTT